MESTTDRWTEIREAHHENPFVYQIMGGAALVALGILLGAAIFAQDEGYATNLYTEIISIGVTVFILNTLAERREESRRIRDLKAQLVRDVGSTSNEAAKRAIDELRHQGWLLGIGSLLENKNLRRANLNGANLSAASLKGIDLSRANLQGVRFNGANLQKADLLGAQLQESNLSSANLQGARLSQSNLQSTLLMLTKLEGADLMMSNLLYSNLGGCNFTNVDLSFSNLEKATLDYATLMGANLRESNLQYAVFQYAKFNDSTILPDGTYWTPETDMTRFTDPNHPNFWRSDDPHSPAYRGDDPDPQ